MENEQFYYLEDEASRELNIPRVIGTKKVTMYSKMTTS